MTGNIMFICLLLTMCVNGQIVLWDSPMNGQFTGWTIESTNTDVAPTNTLCPNSGDSCWRLSSDTIISRTIATTDRQRVSLSYSYRFNNLKGQDYCSITYSIDGSTTEIVSSSADTTAMTDQTLDFPSSVDDNANGLTITITAAVNNADCLFEDFTLNADAITTSPTSDPSSDPTTARPTEIPSNDPTTDPTGDPTTDPTADPTQSTDEPSESPSVSPTIPTTEPTLSPTFERPSSLKDYYYLETAWADSSGGTGEGVIFQVRNDGPEEIFIEGLSLNIASGKTDFYLGVYSKSDPYTTYTSYIQDSTFAGNWDTNHRQWNIVPEAQNTPTYFDLDTSISIAPGELKAVWLLCGTEWVIVCKETDVASNTDYVTDDILTIRSGIKFTTSTSYWLVKKIFNGGLFYRIAGPTMSPTPKPTGIPTTTTSAPTPAPSPSPTTAEPTAPSVTPSPTSVPSMAPTLSYELNCYSQGPCNDGYVDKTNGNSNNWACGSGCVGGQYRTDGVCGCACIEDVNGDGCFKITKPPTMEPTKNTDAPTRPSLAPTNEPSVTPTTAAPTSPTQVPTTAEPTSPTMEPTDMPTEEPTQDTEEPTMSPTIEPTLPTPQPTRKPNKTNKKTNDPTVSPTQIVDDGDKSKGSTVFNIKNAIVMIMFLVFCC